MTHNVIFRPLARDDLYALYTYIYERSGSTRAGSYIDRIEALCKSLSLLPYRGTNRDDLGLDVRTIALERRVLIVYRTTANDVEILRIVYAGQDFSGDDLPD